MPKFLTTADVADLCGVPVWRVQRLFSSGRLPDVERFAGKRAIPRNMLPTIIDALRCHGWLPEANAK